VSPGVLKYCNQSLFLIQRMILSPQGRKRVVLGLVTSKTGELEDSDKIKQRIEEACEYADLDQFCLSPQCGFASTEEGNILGEDEQWHKLGMIVEVARDLWGTI